MELPFAVDQSWTAGVGYYANLTKIKHKPSLFIFGTLNPPFSVWVDFSWWFKNIIKKEPTRVKDFMYVLLGEGI